MYLLANFWIQINYLYLDNKNIISTQHWLRGLRVFFILLKNVYSRKTLENVALNNVYTIKYSKVGIFHRKRNIIDIFRRNIIDMWYDSVRTFFLLIFLNVFVTTYSINTYLQSSDYVFYQNRIDPRKIDYIFL